MHLKKIVVAAFLGCTLFTFAQVDSTEVKRDYGRVFGGFESVSQWYLNDKGRGIIQPEDPIRSNNYLFVNYQIKGWTAGVQVEAYEKNALLNYNPEFD